MGFVPLACRHYSVVRRYPGTAAGDKLFGAALSVDVNRAPLDVNFRLSVVTSEVMIV